MKRPEPPESPNRQNTGTAAADSRESYLKLLASLSSLGPNENEMALVARIALWVDSPEVHEYIASISKWYSGWEIKEAIYLNPVVPQHLQEEIGRCLAVINMMYELDTKKLTGEEREGLKEDIRCLIQTLSEEDRASVKQRAHWLTELRSKTREAEQRQLAREEELQRKISKTYEAQEYEELLAISNEPEPRMVRAVLDNPCLTKDLLVRMIEESENPVFFRAVTEVPKWYDTDRIRKAIWKSKGCPQDVRDGMAETIRGLKRFKHYETMEDGDEKKEFARKLLEDFQLFPSQEQVFVKHKLGLKWSNFITDVLTLIEVRAEQAAPEAVARVDEGKEDEVPQAAPREAVVDEGPEEPRREELPEIEEEAAHPPEEPPEVEARVQKRPPPLSTDPDKMATLTLAQKVHLARTTRAGEAIAFLLHDPEPTVTEALLDNPVLGLEEVEALARTGSREKLERLHAQRKWVQNPRVRLAALQNPNTPQHIAQEALNHVSEIKELMRITRDPNIGAFELKSKARNRLIERYRGMSTEEKVAAIKITGGEIISDLWSEALYDEKVLSRLLTERYLDEAVVLKIARSRIAPRDILLAIGNNRNFISNYQVSLELVQNPKTPREVSSRLIGRLNPQDRQRLKNNKNIPDYVRRQLVTA